MKPDTDAIRKEMKRIVEIYGGESDVDVIASVTWLLQTVSDSCDHIDAQAEEIKRLEIEVANWKYWRGTATKANDKCEAENKRLLDSLELIKETMAGDITAYVNLVHTIVNNALKPNTEEGET